MLRLLSLMAPPLAALALASAAAGAQAFRPPAAGELEAARRAGAAAAQEAGRLAGDRAALREAARAAAAAGREAAPALPPERPLGLDLDAVSAEARRQAEALLKGPGRLAARPAGPAAAGPPPPLVLVSFSVPEPSLRSLLREAARIRAPVVLRGLKDGSLKATVEALLRLQGIGPEASWPPSKPAGHELAGLAVDPTAFRRFRVEAVPAFVVLAEPLPPCTDEACPTPPHLIARGEVSLAYALDVMARQARDRRLGAVARRWAEALRRPQGEQP